MKSTIRRSRIPNIVLSQSWSTAFILAALTSPVCALEALDDGGLSAVSGQDGLIVDITSGSNGITITNVDTTFDRGGGCVVNSVTCEAGVRAEDLSLRAVDGSGNVGGASHLQARVDVGSNAGVSALSIEADLDRSRLLLGALRGTLDTGRSLGTWALDASGQLRMQSDRGIFNGGSSVTGTYLRGTLYDAALFYRQIAEGAPYIIMNDVSASWELNRGSLDATATGLSQTTVDNSVNAGVGPGAGAVNAGSLLNVALDFDILYKNPGSETGFLVNDLAKPMMHFGWLGSLRNAEVVWKGGGTRYGSIASGASDGTASVGDVYDTYGVGGSTIKSQGLNFSTHWDFVSNADTSTPGLTADNEFRWQLGEASGGGSDKSRVNFELGDWARWNPAMYGHNFPYIAIDVLNGQQGPGGLCWGFKYQGSSSGACAPNAANLNGKQFVNIQPGYVAGFTDSAVNRTSGTASSMALYVRDGNLMSYSRRVKFLERDSDGLMNGTAGDWERNFNWGLIYTFANVNASAYVYAGGNPDDVNGGVIVDLSLISQTFAENDNTATTGYDERNYQGFNWDHGSHLMIADTDVNKNGVTGENRDAMGIGLVSSSFMVLANDMRIWVKPTTANPYDGGIDLTSLQTRFALNTTFGGGILPCVSGVAGCDSANPYGTGPRVVRAALIKLNFEGMMNSRLSPAAPVGDTYNPCSASVTGYNCKNYLGYSWAMRFMDTNDSMTGIAAFSENTSGYAGWGGTAAQLGDYGSYLSLSEPNQPDVDVRFANMTGDLSLENGVIDIVGHTEDGDNTPKLRIIHTMKLGAAAAARVDDAMQGRDTSLVGGAGGQEFRIDRVTLGGANLGRIVVPSAEIYSSLTLRPQP